MACLNRHWMSVRPHRLRLLGLPAVVALAGILCSASAVLQATPVTFRFEATVAEGANLPFTISPGDSIATTFTFEPGTSGPTYAQSNAMRFEVAGAVLEIPEFQIMVANDELRWIDVRGRIADPNNTPDTDFNEIGDNIVASCPAGGSLFCGAVPGHGNYMFQPLLVFAHQDSLLSSDDLLADPNLWNAFSFREMSLMFRNLDTGGTTYVGAYIGEIEQVPEPSTSRLFLGLLCLLAIYLLVLRFRKSRAPTRRLLVGSNC